MKKVNNEKKKYRLFTLFSELEELRGKPAKKNLLIRLQMLMKCGPSKLKAYIYAVDDEFDSWHTISISDMTTILAELNKVLDRNLALPDLYEPTVYEIEVAPIIPA